VRFLYSTQLKASSYQSISHQQRKFNKTYLKEQRITREKVKKGRIRNGADFFPVTDAKDVEAHWH